MLQPVLQTAQKRPLKVSFLGNKVPWQESDFPFIISNNSSADIKIENFGESYFKVFFQGKEYNVNQDELSLFFKKLNHCQELHETIEKCKVENKKPLLSELKKNNLKRFLRNSTVYYQDIVKSLIQTEKIEDIPIKLSNLRSFRSHSSFLLLSLQKGDSKSLVCDFNRSTALKKYYIGADAFTNIYSSIKKSKSSFFYQHKVISEQLKLVGCYLCSTFSLDTHNLILIISRDDFVPPSDEESMLFQDFSSVIENALKFIENKNITNSKLSLYLESLQRSGHSPTVMYRNQFSCGEDTPKKKLGQKNKFQLPKHPNLSIFFNANSDIKLSTDIFHYQRVRLMGELFNILKHELSNPIFGMKMSLDILQNEIKDESYDDLIKEIINSSNRALDILNTMTNLFTLSVSKTTIALERLIHQLLSISKSELRRFNLKITYESNELKSQSIQTSPSVAIQILFNLVLNAIQELKNSAPNNGQIEIHTKKDQSFYKIQVIDNGQGIPLSKQEEIFKPFFSSKQSGNGLGLALSRKLAQNLGGNLILKSSTIGKTIFELQIPR